MNHRFFHFLILFIIPLLIFSQTKTKKDSFKRERILPFSIYEYLLVSVYKFYYDNYEQASKNL